jgi:hypothetical protein
VIAALAVDLQVAVQLANAVFLHLYADLHQSTQIARKTLSSTLTWIFQDALEHKWEVVVLVLAFLAQKPD